MKELVLLRVEGGGVLKLTTDLRIDIMMFLITPLKMVVEHGHFGWMGRWFGDVCCGGIILSMYNKIAYSGLGETYPKSYILSYIC